MALVTTCYRMFPHVIVSPEQSDSALPSPSPAAAAALPSFPCACATASRSRDDAGLDSNPLSCVSLPSSASGLALGGSHDAQGDP